MLAFTTAIGYAAGMFCALGISIPSTWSLLAVTSVT